MSSSAISTSFTVSTSMTRYGILLKGSTILKDQELERYGQAVTYAREITPPPAAGGKEWNTWCNEEWDCDGETGKITFRHRGFPDGVAFDIHIIPPPRYNVTFRYYNAGFPVSDALTGATQLKTIKEAMAFTRRKHTVGDGWARVIAEEWDMVVGKGRIEYRHRDEGESTFVVEVSKAERLRVDVIEALMEDRRECM